MGAFSSSPGAIYPALKRCEKSGWIRSEIDQSSPLRPRRVFHLTEAGRKVLKRELERQVDVDDVIWRQGDMILRFAFMDGLLETRQIRAFLESYQRAMETYIETLEMHREMMPEETPRCAVLALEQGIGAHRANATWARHAIRKMQSDLVNEGESDRE